MELNILNDQGQKAGAVSVVDTVFGTDFNEPLIHQIVVAYQANARSGNRAQKDRTEVRHSTKKPWRQKGTGRARAGMTSSPLWRGGGRIFPNKPDENFSQKVNRKMYRAGMRSILSQLVREDRLSVVESLKLEAPKTKLLVGVNAKIVKSVVEQALKHSPNAIFIIISNPMDAMTYLALKSTGLPRNRVIGMGGMLDSSRFRYYLSEALNAAGHPATPSDVDGMVIGGHNDKTMVPLVSIATLRGIPVTQLLSKEVLADVVQKTKVGGATLTGLLGTSAWYAPGASAATLVEAIALDSKKVIPCCVYLEGEYGEKDLCVGVPIVLGKGGFEKVVDVKLEGEEKAKFDESVEAARAVNAQLGDALK